MGRVALLGFYEKAGLERRGLRVRAGAVEYEVVQGRVSGLSAVASARKKILRRLEITSDWRLPCGFSTPRFCRHGSAFFSAVGDDFDDLSRHKNIVNADVLDAWFPPAPGVLEELQKHLSWVLRTSPPSRASGLVRAIANARSVPEESVLVGSGSSALIFLALTEWLSRESRVTLLDPTYGEYAHLLEKIVGCDVERFVLPREDGYRLDLDELLERIGHRPPDWLILVNPNSPTGGFVPRSRLERFLDLLPPTTRVWIDETYVDYVGSLESLERYAAASDNVVVCKSMSKVYALSGLRLAYLCAAGRDLVRLWERTPPWGVSFPAQLAGIRALQSSSYYAERWTETGRLREELTSDLRRASCGVPFPSHANFVLVDLPSSSPPAAEIVRRCATHGVFLRDFPNSENLGERALRVAVKSAAENRRIVRVLARALEGSDL